MKLSLKSILSMTFAAAGFTSCAEMPNTPPGVPLNAAQAPQEVDMTIPFMIREASLPEGFPPPGPVDEVILKEYPAYRAARVEAGDKKNSANSMFQPLFRHIKKNDISMTAPVEMTYKPDADDKAQPVSMAFLYGSQKIGQPARQGDIDVIDLPAQKVISITVRGSYEEGFARGRRQLEEWLSKNPNRFELAGPPRFLGYNSPFVPWFMRIGEVQLPVREVKSPA